MTRVIGLGVFLLVLLAGGHAAWAQALPTPAPSYPDPDPGAAIYPELDLRNPNLDAGLQDMLRRDRRNPVLAAQAALVPVLRGQRGRWQREFDRARAMAEPGSPELRYVLWSRGWAHFSLGEYPAALQHWQEAEALHGGRPEWVPATYAVVLWSMGQRELGLEFFAVAARDRPERWGSVAAVDATVAQWRPNEKLAAQSMASHLARSR